MSNVINLADYRKPAPPLPATVDIEIEALLDEVLLSSSRACVAASKGEHATAAHYRDQAIRLRGYVARRGYSSEQIDAMLVALAVVG